MWFERLKSGTLSLQLGGDNIFVPVSESDIGSVISYALASNIYKEAMMRQNYMDIVHKVKGIKKQQLEGNIEEEVVRLLDKTDVFNTELTNHQIETELLNGERLNFILKFSSHKKDLSLKIVKNAQTSKLNGTSLTFMTGAS